jgi:hypothetical protein
MRGLVVALAIAGALPLSSTARAQAVPPPAALPDVPDEPMPEWHAPPPRRSQALFLGMAPQLRAAQRERQFGLGISAAGWIIGFVGGLTFVGALEAQLDLETPPDGRFHPDIEDKRDNIVKASTVMFGVGGVMALSGFVVYTIGQSNIHKWHKLHPKDPLPPLSGF